MMVSSISVGVCPFKTSTRLIGDAREGRPVPHVGLPAKIVDRGGHGKRVVDAGQGRGSPGGCAGEVREGVEEGQGTDAGRGLLGHGLEPGQRTPAPGGGGRAPAGPWEAGARGQGPQVLLTGALKILQRVWAAGGGVVAVSTSRSPCRCCWTCWRGPVSSTASPATAQPSGPGRVAMSAATIDRYLAPAGARAVRGRSTAKGRSRLARLHQDPQGRRARWRPSPGLFEARHRRPLRSGAQGGVRPDR